MFFEEVYLKNFRNYEEEKIDFNRNINIFIGENAQGKTNILESLFIMGLGKSFRTNKDSEMIGFEKEFCTIKTVVCDDFEEEKNELKIIYKKEGKIVNINGVKASKNIDMIGKVYIVVFSPEDLKIVKEGPENRRVFLDREICQIKPIYYKNLSKYKKVLSQRNMLLKKGNVDKNLLDAFDEALVEYGLKIAEERESFVKRLKIISKEIHSTISEGKEELEIQYESNVNGNIDLSTKEERKELFYKNLKKEFSKDILRGFTGIGPHKDDLKIEINKIDIRQFGSQGQQRTAALSMKLAEINLIKEETGKKAILLLDDVLSELDAGRQRFLIEAMKDVQVFITATEIENEVLELLPKGWVFKVKEGNVKRLT
ncbi:MAG: DNA replication/repair protein RecF [Clostridia bacterium]|nr:DNA replication/repair protein RecF [Clostridia bacterium]